MQMFHDVYARLRDGVCALATPPFISMSAHSLPAFIFFKSRRVRSLSLLRDAHAAAAKMHAMRDAARRAMPL